ncbi:hypothetical protein Tco_1436127, partial [Tanacetum coccineum]
MMGDREKFKNVDETLKSQVRLGDDKQVKVEGNGTVVVTLQGWERFIPDVHYAPGLAHNLPSVGQLMDRGFDVFFNRKNKTCTVIKDGEVMVKSSMTENKMFPVDFSCDNIYGLISSKEESSDVKALFFIQQATDETIFSRIVAANSAKEAWDTLKTEYQGSAK